MPSTLIWFTLTQIKTWSLGTSCGKQTNKQIKLVSHFTFSQFSHVTDIFPKGRKDGGDSSNTTGSSSGGGRRDILARYIL